MKLASYGASNKQEDEAFSKYLSSRKILIVDPSSSARSSVFRVFQDLGAETSQILLTNNFKQAVATITEAKPHIVVAEYDLGKQSGLDVFQTHRAQYPGESKQTLFVIVTGNTSQSAVARAAEEDIDAYLLKPFTASNVRSTIMKAALAKIKPSQYNQAIDAGKTLLGEGKLDEAEKEFKRACELEKQPALALYYLGQTKFLRKILDQAKGSYGKGLEFNKIHYKCLVGMYELLVSQKENVEAYEIVKRISQYFPANPKRLAEVLRLAIMNGKYEDVEKYYQIFCNIDERDEVLIRYICAALVVCGKYYLNSKNRQRAKELFSKAAATGSGRVIVLKQIVQALIDHDYHKDAQEFLEKFPATAHTGPEYLLLRFQLLNASGNRSLTIEMGRDLLSKGISSEHLFAIMIQHSVEAKLTAAAQNLMQQACQKYPSQKAIFESIFKNPKTFWTITS